MKNKEQLAQEWYNAPYDRLSAWAQDNIDKHAAILDAAHNILPRTAAVSNSETLAARVARIESENVQLRKENSDMWLENEELKLELEDLRNEYEELLSRSAGEQQESGRRPS